MRDAGLNLVEVFWSVQGEGVHVGLPSVFVRFGECDLRCSWCDSPETWKRALRCRLETEPGTGRFDEVANPVDVTKTADVVARLLSVRPASMRKGLVSITGGEPLLQPDGVLALARELRARGMRTLLETHGLAGDALDRVASEIDVVSMDWKLASSVRRESDPRRGPVAPFHDQHEDFLRRAGRAGDVYVKVVVTVSTDDHELAEVCERIARTAPLVPLILQPVTPYGRVRETPSAARILGWVRACEERLGDVRLIPQTHKMLGVA
jgi:organic radical activating enzyme